MDAYIKQKLDSAETIFKYDIDWASWSKEKFDSSQIHEMTTRMNHYVDQELSRDTASALNLRFYQELIYKIVTPNKYSMISGLQQVVLYYDKKTYEADYTVGNNTERKSVIFSDCMESTIMNFICILAYNENTRLFDIKNIESQIKIDTKQGDIKFNEKFIKFMLGKYEVPLVMTSSLGAVNIIVTPTSMTEPVVRNCWTDVTSNIPGVAYLQKLNKDEFKIHNATGKMFIRVPSEKICDFVRELYEPIDFEDKSICYELCPSLKNFIVIINYFLGLNLYGEKDVFGEILRKDFVKEYLPKLSDKLNIDFKPSFPLAEIDSLDKENPEHLILTTELIFEKDKPAQLDLVTISPVHAELQTLPYNDNEKKALHEIVKKIPDAYSNTLPSLKPIKLLLDSDIINYKFQDFGFLTYFGLKTMIPFIANY